MTASRMRRFVGGLTVGYLHTAIVTIVGLWLTPFHFHPSLLNNLMSKCANRWPHGYEHRWSWMFPARFMSVRLEVVREVP